MAIFVQAQLYWIGVSKGTICHLDYFLQVGTFTVHFLIKIKSQNEEPHTD